MFGRSLAETVKFEARRGGGYVPLVVHKCVDFIRAHGKKNWTLQFNLWCKFYFPLCWYDNKLEIKVNEI